MTSSFVTKPYTSTLPRKRNVNQIPNGNLRKRHRSAERLLNQPPQPFQPPRALADSPPLPPPPPPPMQALRHYSTGGVTTKPSLIV